MTVKKCAGMICTCTESVSNPFLFGWCPLCWNHKGIHEQEHIKALAGNFCPCSALMRVDAKFCHHCGRIRDGEKNQIPAIVEYAIVIAMIVLVFLVIGFIKRHV